MAVLTRSAARKLAQQQAVEAEARAQKVQRARKADHHEVVTTIITSSATGLGTHIRWKYTKPPPRTYIGRYPPPCNIGLPAYMEHTTFCDASFDSIEWFKAAVASSSGAGPSTSSTVPPVPSLSSTDSSAEHVERAYTPPPMPHHQIFQTPARKQTSCVRRPLQQSPGHPLQRRNQRLSELGAPGTRLALVEDDLSTEAIARRNLQEAQRAEEISKKYWAELLADKRARDYYIMRGLAGMEADGTLNNDIPFYGLRPSMLETLERRKNPNAWNQHLPSPCPTEQISN